MSNHIKGSFDGSDLKIGVIAARFNEFITSKLLAGAEDALIRHAVPLSSIDVVWVPGALEIPVAAKRMAATRKYDSIICIGCVIRGETAHYDHVCRESISGVAKVARDTSIPVITAILTTENLEQAIDRAGAKGGNKGFDAGVAAIEMVNAMRAMESRTAGAPRLKLVNKKRPS